MKLKRLALSIVYIVFSVASAVTGTFAWFSSNSTVSAGGMNVAIVNETSSELVDLSLYKFEYPDIDMGNGLTRKNYLSPENGDVLKYSYNKDESSFGTYDNESNFTAVNTKMNVYDPLEALISDSSLVTMNANVIYEAKIHFFDLLTADLNITASIYNKVIQKGKIKASDCIEFDVYFDSDLSSDALITSGIKNYYPSFIDQNETMSATEEIYYKLSYLSSIKTEEQHMNLFDATVDDKIQLYRGTKDLDLNGEITIYINANYCESKLSKYAQTIRDNNIDVVRNYRFLFEKEN